LLIFVGGAISQGPKGFPHLSLREALMLAAFSVLWLGLLLGWKWELWGGLLTISGFFSIAGSKREEKSWAERNPPEAENRLSSFTIVHVF